MLKGFLYSKKVVPYVFASPFILFFLIFFLYPICYTGYMSLYSVRGFAPPQFSGLANYALLKKYTASDRVYAIWLRSLGNGKAPSPAYAGSIEMTNSVTDGRAFQWDGAQLIYPALWVNSDIFDD